MTNQNDIAALYTSSPALLTTAIVILVVIALILMSWGACIYGVISSCATRRRRRADEEEVELRREQVHEFVLSVIGRTGLNVDAGSVWSESASIRSSSTEQTLVPAGPVVMDLKAVEEKVDEAELPSSTANPDLDESTV